MFAKAKDAKGRTHYVNLGRAKSVIEDQSTVTICFAKGDIDIFFKDDAQEIFSIIETLRRLWLADNED